MRAADRFRRERSVASLLAFADRLDELDIPALARPRALRKPRHPVTLNSATAALRSGTNSKEMLGSREFRRGPFLFPAG